MRSTVIKRKWRVLGLMMALVALLLGSGAHAVLAEGPPPAETPVTADPGENDEGQMRNCMDPNYVYTEKERRAIAAKEKQMQEYLKTRASGYGLLSVGTWLEPDDYAHRNYCGPGAAQVALDARLPASQVPDIDTLGAEMNINPNSGVYMTDLRDVLNDRLNTTWYSCSSSDSRETLYNRIVANIDSGYALVTGCVTDQMPGWELSANHIVAVYGYLDAGVIRSTEKPQARLGYDSVFYTETSRPSAGYYGGYRQSAPKQAFWTYVSPNDIQAW